MSDFNLASIGQVGLLVRDLEAAMEAFQKSFGIGPWKVYTNSAPPLRCYYRGRPVSYRMRVALAQSGPLVIELLQYVDGECLHHGFQEAVGVGACYGLRPDDVVRPSLRTRAAFLVKGISPERQMAAMYGKATGAGRGKDNVCLTFFGDGATNRGDFHESMNLIEG